MSKHIWYLKHKTSSLYYGVKNFLLNIVIFRKTLWRYRSWDWTGLYQGMYDSIKEMENTQRVHGNHVSHQKTAKDMRVCMKLLERLIDEDYMKISGYDLDVVWERDGEYKGVGCKYVKLSPAVLPYRHERTAAIEKQDRELLFKLLCKQSKTWWD